MNLHRHDSALLLALVVTVASFLAATIYTQRQLARLDELSHTIQSNAVPSVEFLARSIASLTRLREVLEIDGRRRVDASGDAARQELQTFDRGIEQYLQLNPLPGEEDLWDTLHWHVERARAAADVALATLDAGDEDQFALAFSTAVDPAFDKAIDVMWETFRFDIRQSERLAQTVRELRTSTRNTVTVLNLLATAVAGCAASFAFRASRRHDQLTEAHRRLLADRVTQLDRFGGQVAHDILSPLGTIGFSLQILARSHDGADAAHIQRAQRGLERVQQLVDGLLTFARSGARSHGDAQCSMDMVLENVEADCADDAAAAGVMLTIRRPSGFHLACSLGVATSIVENLVRNAIKYMGDRPVKRVDVRVERRGQSLRIQVEDTGAGIPVSIQSILFEPFVRGHEHGSGIGLGLATVKRLVEGHGGHITVQSQPDLGSTFSIDLPVAEVLTKSVARSPGERRPPRP
jgi:signal transduction histidine kinase